MKLFIKYIFLLFIGLSSNQLVAGWVISEVSSDKYDNKQYQTTFIQNNMIRFETQSSVAIIDLKTGNITLLFGLYRLYWQGSIKEFKESTLEIYEQKLHNIIMTAPPSQKIIAQDIIAELRKQYETNDVDTINNISLKIIKTNIIDTISGFKSIKYNIVVDSSFVESIWITDSINPYSDIDIESMISFTKELNPGKNGNSIEGSNEYLNIIKQGLATKSEEITPEGNITTIVSGVIETNINPELFLPPPNYRKAQLAEIMLITDKSSGAYKLQEEFNNAKENSLYR